MMSNVYDNAKRGLEIANRYKTQEQFEIAKRFSSADDWVALGALVYVAEENGPEKKAEMLLAIMGTLFCMGYEAAQKGLGDDAQTPSPPSVPGQAD